MLLAIKQFAGNPEDLLGGFARPKNHFRKAFPQCAMHIHLRKSEVLERRRLKRAHDFVAADAAGAEFFEQPRRFRRRHQLTMPQERQNPSAKWGRRLTISS